MRIEIVIGTDYKDLENQINSAVSDKDDAKVEVDFKHIAAVISYAGSGCKDICVDCQYFDDGGEHDCLIGMCQMRGKRVRFSNKSCGDFLDVRRRKK